MIHDPASRGAALAEFFLELEPRLFADLAQSSAARTLPPLDRAEWSCFALYACVRGLIAAGGFNRESAAAIEALHERVLAAWESAAEAPRAHGGGSLRALIAERYGEYGAIGQAGGAAGATTVAQRLGAAAARHVAGGDAKDEFADLVGALHESLVEGAAEAVRQATE